MVMQAPCIGKTETLTDLLLLNHMVTNGDAVEIPNRLVAAKSHGGRWKRYGDVLCTNWVSAWVTPCICYEAIWFLDEQSG